MAIGLENVVMKEFKWLQNNTFVFSSHRSSYVYRGKIIYAKKWKSMNSGQGTRNIF